MPPSSTLFTTSRVLAYSLTSTLAATTVVYNAFRDRPNFYSAMVALGRSNGNVGILLNFGLLVTFMMGRFMQLLFFGNLRRVEIEHLWERTWYSVTDSLFAMTIFRDQFDAGFVILFVALLFVKVFHWLVGDRVELMEQTPSLPRFFHFRMISILGTLLLVDFISILFFVEFLVTEKERSGLIIMFASEFMILFCTLNNTLAKYLINCYDLRNEEPWEQKSMWVSTADLVTDFCKLLTYLIFFSLIFSYYGLPLNIVRDVWMTGRSFYNRIRDLIRYRAATKNMDQRYPNATSEELARTDGTCIICREEMVIHGSSAATPASNPQASQPQLQPQPPAQAQAQPSNRPTTTSASGLNETPKKLPCGHIFHFYCLRSWLERQQSCPTCRRTVLDANGQPVNQPPPAVPGAVPGRPAAAAAATGAAGAAPTGNLAANPPPNSATNAAQRVGLFARQLETQVERQRQLELEGSVGSSSGSTSSAAPAASPVRVPNTTTANAPGAAPLGSNSTLTRSSAAPAGGPSSLSDTAQRQATTVSGIPHSLIAAVFADPAASGSANASQAGSVAVAAAMASGSRAQWGSAYGAQPASSFGQIGTSAPPGYGYHQNYPNRQSQPHHGLPLPNGSPSGTSWTPPRPSSLASPQVQVANAAQPNSSTSRNSAPVNSQTQAQAPSSRPRFSFMTPQAQATATPSNTATNGAGSASASSPLGSPPVRAATVEEAPEEPLDPREAARAAALKRLASRSKPANRPASRPINRTDNQKPTSTERTSTEEVKVEQSAEANVASRSSEIPGNPQLIPLFDPSVVPDYKSLHEVRLPYPLVLPSPSTPVASSNGFNLSSLSSRLETSTSHSAPNSGSSIPTRESLEQSLKALVAVQENVWKAIEEVTRVVSSLPASSSSNSQAQSDSAPVAKSTVGGQENNPSNWKGKQAAEGVNAAPNNGSTSSRSASPPPPSARSISPTLSPPTRTQNPWSNEHFSSSALSSGNSTPAIEHSQSTLFSSNPMPRSNSPSRENPSSTSGLVVDELDMTDEQRNHEVNSMVHTHKPQRRVSFASRDDHIEPTDEKETSEESQQEETAASLVNGHPGEDNAIVREIHFGGSTTAAAAPEAGPDASEYSLEDAPTVNVNGIDSQDEIEHQDIFDSQEPDSLPVVDATDEGDDEESREAAHLHR